MAVQDISQTYDVRQLQINGTSGPGTNIEADGASRQKAAVVDVTRSSVYQAADRVEISREGRAALERARTGDSREKAAGTRTGDSREKAVGTRTGDSETKAVDSGEKAAGSGKRVEETPEFKNAVRELVNNEHKVVSHEQAHKSAGGEVAGVTTYSYTVGPDGKRYISGGEVSISIPPTDDKEKMVQLLERVKQAALAPADPSGQDLKVAADASAKQMTLRGEIMKEKAQKAYSRQIRI